MTLEQQLKKTESGLRAWHQERAIFETTNMMCELMEKDPKVSRKELAKRLGTGKSYVSQLLDGSSNMTLRTISDAFLAIGYEFHPAFSRIGDNVGKPQVSVELQLDAIAKDEGLAIATAFQDFRVALNNAAAFEFRSSLVS